MQAFSRARNSLGVVFFPAFDWAISPTHPEREERLLYTRDQLKEEGLFDIEGIREYRPRLMPLEDVARVHFCLPSIRDVVTDSHLAAAGGAIEAARLVLEGREKKAFALVRPPGHHAMRVAHGNRGFCNINNEALMLAWIRANYRIQGRPLRLAIVDTDVHHGDGSQDIFWNDPDTLFISLHQDGRTLYPGTGAVRECGGPAALGRTVNIPLPPGTCDDGYLYVMEHVVLPILRDFAPDLVVNSAGQDNHFTDPLASELLTARGYAALNTLLDPDIAVLEGGYSIRGALPYVNMGICLALAGLDASDIREPDWDERYLRQSARVTDQVCAVAEEALAQYFDPPKAPWRGREEHGFWVEDKQIYYDTDGISEGQRVYSKLCSSCAGYTMWFTQSTRTALSFCVLVPRDACASCRNQAHEQVHEARASGRFAHVLCLDETSFIPNKSWPLEEKTWPKTS